MRDVPTTVYQAASKAYQRRWVRSNDLVYASTDVSRFMDVAPNWGNACFRPGFGADGADRALVDVFDLDAVSRGCEVAYIGSGDWRFAAVARQLRQRGLHVTVVAWPHTLSGQLLAEAHRVIDLSRAPLVAA